MLYKILNYFLACVIGVIIAFAGGFLSAKFMGNDGPIEEACEFYLKEKLGIDIDFSRSRPGHS